MTDSIESRPSDSAIQFVIDNHVEIAEAFAYTDAFHFPRLLDRFAQRERISAVREFIEKVHLLTLQYPGKFVSDAQREVFAAMFNDEEI